MGLIITPVSDASLVTTDITTNDASTSKHGFRAKLTNVARSYQDEAGTVRATVVDTGIGNTYTTGAQSFAAATSLLVPASGGYAPTADGSLGYDTTQDTYAAGGAGGVVGYLPRVLYATQSTTDTLTAATINTTETQFAGTYQIPANYLIANKTLIIDCIFYSTATATIPTSILRIRLGSVGITGTIVCQSTTTALTAGTFVWGARFILSGTGAAGASVNTLTGPLTIVGNNSAGGRSVTNQPVAIATNAAQNINLTWTYSSNAASNTVTLQQLIVTEVF